MLSTACGSDVSGHVFQIGMGANRNLSMCVSLLGNQLCQSEEVSVSRSELKLQISAV